MTYTELPGQGVVFWPVGTGDSTTIVVDDTHVLQVDLRDMKAADEDEAVVSAVIDRLTEKLPTTVDGEPYLAAFALTHADFDHCAGFGDLLDSDIVVGELWATPRLWREFDGDEPQMCEDARRFQKEAGRRVAETLKALDEGREPASGDRIRIIGYDVDRADHSYAELPEAYFTFPGQAITSLDGDELPEVFEAFVHAPFKDDCAAARNDTSLAMQITLRHPGDGTEGHLLLLGDLAYATIVRIFENSETFGHPDRLWWHVMQSAHHCSRFAMYAPGEDGTEELKEDMLDHMASYAMPDAYVVASSRPFRDADKSGDNPPHLLARERYEEITSNAVLCTGEYPDSEAPRPIVFGLEPGQGLVLVPVDEAEAQIGKAQESKSATLLRDLAVTAVAFGAVAAAARAAARARDAQVPAPRGGDAAQQRHASVLDAVRQARGGDAQPVTAVGFGRRAYS